ncbi:hypothetical protein LCGC14_1233730 [marine sediment metagenome]|uniref:Uncharacterized protein n=1 Tax=marine sediment metagenome TaxID=412755 RepID=A0A0F9NPY5_9ZZZZ
MADEETLRRLEQVRQQFGCGLGPREVRLIETILAALKGRNEARTEVKRLRRWVASQSCTDPKWPPASDTTESSDCGDCVPCKARAALAGG